MYIPLFPSTRFRPCIHVLVFIASIVIYKINALPSYLSLQPGNSSTPVRTVDSNRPIVKDPTGGRNQSITINGPTESWGGPTGPTHSKKPQQPEQAEVVEETRSVKNSDQLRAAFQFKMAQASTMGIIHYYNAIMVLSLQVTTNGRMP